MRIPSARSAAPLVLGGAVVLCAALWLAALASVEAGRVRLIEAATRENRNHAIGLQHYVEAGLESADARIRHLAARLDGFDVNAQQRPVAVLGDSATADPLLVAIDIVDSGGTLRWSSLPVPGPIHLADNPEFRALAAAAAKDRRFVAAPAPLRGTGVPAIALARPIRSPGGGFGGMVVARIAVARLVDFQTGAQVSPRDLYAVIRADGETLARRDGAGVTQGQDLAGKPVMRHQAADPDGTFVARGAIDGVERIFSHRRIAPYGIFVSSGIDLHAALAEAASRTNLFFAAVAALTATLLGGAALFLVGLRRRDTIIGHLAATNDRLREAQRIGQIGDWELDVASGTLACSEEVCRMHGHDPLRETMSSDEALGYHPPAAREVISQTLRSAILGNHPAHCDVQSRLADGRDVHLRICMFPAADAAGWVHTVRGTEQDITIEKRHEALRAEVAHIARVDAVNVMAATIAHELSQPLAAAANYLAAAAHLADPARGSAVDQERLAVSVAQASRQVGLTGKIIQRAREMVSDRAAGERASVEEIVADAIALGRIANPAAGRISVTAALAPDTRHIAADKVQIQQVLLNLLRNAAQALEGVPDARVVISSRREPGGMAMICVADNGPGLPADAGDIFSAFGAQRRNGLGLGLSICRTLVDSYGGRIWNEPSPMGGAAICFTLPLDELAMLYAVA